MTAAIAQRLRDAASALQGERVPMRMLAQAHGPDAQGSVLLLVATACLLPVPGVGTVLGLGLLALAVALWSGRCADGLPQRVAALALPRPWAQRLLRGLAAAYALAGRHARPRLQRLAQCGPRSCVAGVVVLMALLIVAPIPLGNVLPALALVCIGLGLVLRDGAAVALGLGTAVLALLVTGSLVSVAGSWGGAWLQKWMAL